MNFIYELTAVEYAFLTIFLVLYAFYIGRTVMVARAMGTTARAIVIKFFLRTTYFGVLLVALMGPFFGEPERNIIAEGKDIMVVIDVSKSMDATDMKPSRLEKVKYELQQLLKALPNERFGLVIFSTNAYLQVPLTFDLSAFDLFLQALNTQQVSNTGTDICQALALAQQTLFKDHSNTSKIILLFTDGEDFGNCQRRVLSSIRQFDLKLFVVGVGTPAGGTISSGQSLIQDDNGNPVVSKLNVPYLRELVMATNGKYFEISPQTSTTSTLVESIGAVENKLVDSRQAAVVSNKYRYFLLLALGLLILDVLITITTFQI